ncbi:MAG TPA: hypothetical protein VLC98_02955 [Phnomibacter sp.]|nr:hypothetical protein [Phnomibacter sp.]
MKHLLTLGVTTLLSLAAQAQLVVQSGATLFIDAGASVTVQGDVTSSSNITGTGKLVLKGTAVQNLNMNGFQIANLEVDNINNVLLTGLTEVKNSLVFVNGKIQMGNYNLILDSVATFSGQGAAKFVEANGTGELRKELSAAGVYILPLGVGADYTPLEVTIAGGTFTNAYVGGKAVSGGHPAMHPRTTDYLNQYWSFNRSGVTGNVSAVGTYIDPSDVTGIESDLRSMTYSGGVWSMGTGQDNATNTISGNIGGNTADLFAMNRFILNTPKVFLQGAYNSGTGLMNDNLRTAPALIPTSDPYRSAPYNSAFSHVNNSVPETINASVLNNQANPGNDIVDWVFIELRSISSPTIAPVLQTRSALIQRDGDIVDVDGVSPLYFKNVDAGNYAVTVRHRNHLAMSTNPASPVALSLNNSVYDFTTSGASGIFGTAGPNYAVVNTKNVLLAGNANINTGVSYVGLSTDRAQLLLIMGNPSGAATPARLISSPADYMTYGAGDLNFDRKVDYVGLSPDRAYLLSNPLGGVTNPSPAKVQVLPQ